MTKPLTDEEKDRRKWAATAAYLAAYNDYVAAIKVAKKETYSEEVRTAWANLMTAQKQYTKVAKRYGFKLAF
jgi:uncharacterized protein YciW